MARNSSKKLRASSRITRLDRSADNRAIGKAIKSVTRNKPLSDIEELGALSYPLNSIEASRYPQIKTMLEDYASREKVDHPLSIVVFGPPGSGKSFAVKEIVKSIQGKFVVSLSANLSQLTSTEELADAFHEAIGELDKAKERIRELGKDNKKTKERDKENSKIQKHPKAQREHEDSSKIKELLKVTPVFIFDEFDTALNGISLGWLRWFLAPMQDGAFLHNSETVAIRKAVFIFSGGTAASFNEFEEHQQRDPIEYRNKKVPDFISRLRGFIDIQGINQLESDRAVRRAIVLNRLLDNRWPDRRGKHTFPIKPDLVEHLLSHVHFVHGVRSMEAILEMSSFGRHRKLGLEQLPDEELKKLHLSRGLLDKTVIGISAGQDEEEASDFLHELTRLLLRHGATLAYGGEFVIRGTLDWIVKAARHVPDYFVKRDDKRIRNYLGFPIFNKPAIMARLKKVKDQVEPFPLETLTRFERKALGVPSKKWFPARPRKKSGKYNPKHHLAWALSLFRMRARLVHDIDALIVVGGKDQKNDRSWGRFSGIAEEVMLAVALGKPIFVLGGRGGAAHAVGRLLGLDQSPANPDSCLADVGGLDPAKVHKNFANCFTMPGLPNLPQTVPVVRNYLFEHSVLTDSWPKNGLTLDENRELFTTKINPSEWGRCADLIIQGLTRLDWKHPADPGGVTTDRFSTLHRNLGNDGNQRFLYSRSRVGL